MTPLKRPFDYGSAPTGGSSIPLADSNKKVCTEGTQAKQRQTSILSFFTPKKPSKDADPIVVEPSTPATTMANLHLNDIPKIPSKTKTITNNSSDMTPAKSVDPTTPKVNPPIPKVNPSTSRVYPPTRDENQLRTDTPADDLNHPHLSYKFLYPPERRDIYKRKPDHPEYDERTLYVPQSFLDSQTPALRQWWLIKQQNMDAIIFFKMGKFYELFNDDAVIGVNNLDIIYMKGDDTKPAHAGFPEVSYEKYARMLIERGYKVLRVEQTETPAMMEQRCKETGLRGKFDKVVKREVCRITTRGTQMLGIMDSVFHSSNNQYLMALRESELTSGGRQGNSRVYGVCFVDVTTSKLYIGQFEDDSNLSKFNVLLAHNKPTEVLFEKGNISAQAHQSLLRTGALLSPLKATREFWPIQKAINYLKTHHIFSDELGPNEWPYLLKKMFQMGDSSDNLTASEPLERFKYGLDSFGAIVFYLQKQLIIDQVLQCASFELYLSPLESCAVSKSSEPSICRENRHVPMVMDHIALRNLEIFENYNGSTAGTLFESLNHCKTHFGQRLLKSWLCSPLRDISQIKNRQDAVEVLISNDNASLMNEITHMLNPTPDLERLLSKIKSQCFKSQSDSRAIMFDGDQYSKAKISSFLNLFHNFKRIRKFIMSVDVSAKQCKSTILRRLMTFTTDDGLFPDYTSTIEYFDSAFDHEVAKKTGKIIPAPGVDKAYDQCQADIEGLKQNLDDYLEKQKTVLRCRSLEYFGTAKNRYQIQVPEAYCKKVPDDYTIETTRKGYKRYYTPTVIQLFKKLTTREEALKRILDGIMSTIFEKFARKLKLWSAAIECVAVLDVIQSIASFVRSLRANDVVVCRPEFIDQPIGDPKLMYKNGRHPALVRSLPDYIPNDLLLDQRLVLLSGANMGGKSTLMRQTALLVVLAQIGSYVPASEMQLTTIDRIFSRLGASDRLMEGESTFYTELIETSAMVHYATQDSLLLLDELGRGTSTFDGTAIAYAVLTEIKEQIRCRCIFSTHYHSLIADVTGDKNVRIAHMACKVERDSDDSLDYDPLRENISFLYKIAEGPVKRSYGFNVAKLAGISEDIIREANKKSQELMLITDAIHRLQK